jgi:hypothetical protein
MTGDDNVRPRRAIGLADVMILFAATAAALAWLQKPLEGRLTFVSDGRIIENVRPATFVGAAFAATWGAGILAMRLRPPRPTSNSWRYRPGFVACAAGSLGCLLKIAALLIWGAFAHIRFERWYVPSILGQLIEPAAMAVAGAWLTLWLAGLWKRERKLVDDLGIIGWIAFCKRSSYASRELRSRRGR